MIKGKINTAVQLNCVIIFSSSLYLSLNSPHFCRLQIVLFYMQEAKHNFELPIAVYGDLLPRILLKTFRFLNVVYIRFMLKSPT